jgi:transposase-like protein
MISEKLQEEEKIVVSDETVRRWLIQAGLVYRRRRDRPHRQWRVRKECFGEMLQIDGSHHEWLEGRGPKLVLMALIDDATSLVYARFYDYEGTIPALDCMKRYIRRFGIPCSVYLDRHSTYKSLKKLSIEDELKGKVEAKSQFERAMQELAIRVIHANSAPAKGRVERLFRTLQDRLVKEMRLRGITTREEANQFLSHYLVIHNRRFNKITAQPKDLHRAVDKGINLDAVLSVKTDRFLRNDFTVAHNGKLYQIYDRVRARTVTIEDRLNGSVYINGCGKYVHFCEIPKLSKTLEKNQETPVSRQGKTRKPPAPGPDHPFKAGLFRRRINASSVPSLRSASLRSPSLRSGADDQQQT